MIKISDIIQNSSKFEILSALKAAFPYTIPIMTGFCFLGLAYGIYMHILGFNFLYPMLMAALIFGGSLEFIAATMLLIMRIEFWESPNNANLKIFIELARGVWYNIFKE